jgi:phage baseplate assembly protein W
MSQLEKNLYKRVSVTPNKSTASSGRVYRGFSSVSTQNENFALYDFELIKQDLINHFHIRQGEKLSNPQFGCIIWDLLYEPFTQAVQDAIVQNVTTIVNYDPRLTVEDIVVDTYEQGITVECKISYLPYSISEQLRFRFDQSNGLL